MPTSTSASTSPASSSSSTVRHSDMDGALGDAHLCRPPRRLVRTSIFADSSSSRLAHTRSDQPTCAIHLAPVTSVIVLRASSPSMDGGRCFASSGSSGTVRGVPRRCIFTAADYVLDFVHAGHFDRIFDIVYDYVSARLARTWSSLSCSSSSSPSSSSAAASSGSSGLAPDHLGLPRRFVQHHLVAIVAVHFYHFVYSSNCRLHRHLLPRRSSAPATVVEAFSAGPSDNGVLVVHSPSHVRSWQHLCVPSSPMHSWVWQTRRLFRSMACLRRLRHRLSLRLPRRVAVFVSGV